MISNVDTLRTLPHGRLLDLARDHILSMAEDIRQSQSAMVSARMLGAWTPRAAARYATLMGMADVLVHFHAEGQSAQQWNKANPGKLKHPSAALIAVSDHLRAAMISEAEERAGIKHYHEGDDHADASFAA